MGIMPTHITFLRITNGLSTGVVGINHSKVYQMMQSIIKAFFIVEK
jgi:hypothetical protein